MSYMKILLRNLTPPLIWGGLRKLLKSKPPKLVGVYKKFSDIPQENQWDSDLWLLHQKGGLKRIAEQANCYLPELPRPYDLTALYLNQLSRQNNISVLDFGGGSGEVFYKLARSGGLLYKNNVNWTVVDNSSALNLGIKFKETSDKITFKRRPELPINQQFDVLHINTVLQYIDDIDGLLEKLIKDVNPSHLIFTRLLGGANNTEYFTKNYAFGNYCPVHIFNLKKIIKIAEKNGFYLVYRALNSEEQLSPADYSDVPIELQVYNTAHLFFTR